MNTWDTCKNCGGEYGLHHYQTNQCPVGGREAAIGTKQEYKSTVFELDDTTAKNELAALRAELQNALSKLAWTLGRIEDYRKEAARLENENAELVKALENICDQFGTATYANVKAAVIDARAALAKHKG